MVECIFLFHERLHKSLPASFCWVRARNEDRLPGRTRVLPSSKAQDCYLQHLGNPRRVSNWEASSKFPSHVSESEASLKNTQLWSSFLHCSAKTYYYFKSFKMRMKSHFFTLFYWKPLYYNDIPFWILLHNFQHTFFLFKGMLSNRLPQVFTC